MSILGYSASYFLPEYWSNTPLYGEKIIPLLDYLLSTEYEGSDGLAQAYYNVINKYKNPTDLPIDVVEEIINENGYSYVKVLLGENEESLRLLLTLMVLIHELKGSKVGIEVVLNLLKKDNSVLVMQAVGTPVVGSDSTVRGLSLSDYILFPDYCAEGNNIEINLKISGFNLLQEQCVASIADYGLYLGVDNEGHLVLSLGSDRTSWNILNKVISDRVLTPGISYYIKLLYDGYEYALQVSVDGKNYETWISVDSFLSLGIHNGTLYLGVDYSTGTISFPFSGTIDFSNFSLNIENTEIVQWFEQTPVGEENTFIIKSSVDIALVSTAFFTNFSNFIKKYVYPSLQAFEANLTFNNKVTFLPYVRQKVTYVAQLPDVPFLVKTSSSSSEATDLFKVNDGTEEGLDFKVVEVS